MFICIPSARRALPGTWAVANNLVRVRPRTVLFHLTFPLTLIPSAGNPVQGCDPAIFVTFKRCGTPATTCARFSPSLSWALEYAPSWFGENVG